MEQIAEPAGVRALRVLIAGEERGAGRALRRPLSRIFGVAVVGEAETAEETIDRVLIGRPDTLLLAIRPPVFDGLRVAQRIASVSVTHSTGFAQPKIIFFSASPEFAARAFELRAIDYLLEPVDSVRLDNALARVRWQIELEQRPRAAAGDSPFIDRVCVQTNGRIQVVRLADVEWLEACGNYVRLHMTQPALGHPMLRETLRHLLTRLDPRSFARVHRSAIVSLDRIREMRSCSTGDYIIELASGTRLRLSRSYRAQVDGRLRRRA